MSSEDLVRYFRYLLQNAKTLYVKHLRKGRWIKRMDIANT